MFYKENKQYCKHGYFMWWKLSSFLLIVIKSREFTLANYDIRPCYRQNRQNGENKSAKYQQYCSAKMSTHVYRTILVHILAELISKNTTYYLNYLNLPALG